MYIYITESLSFVAFYGVLFKDNLEAAFSNFRLWNSIGFIIVFACSNFICMDIKIYIILVILILSIPTYLITEKLARSIDDSDFLSHENTDGKIGDKNGSLQLAAIPDKGGVDNKGFNDPCTL